MLKIINNQNINNIFYSNNSNLNNPISFKSKNINKLPMVSYNEFVKLRRNHIMDIDKADLKDIGELLKRRAGSLPQTVNSMFYGIGMYLKGDTPLNEFVDKYCKLTEPLYRRISVGSEKELFNESYAPELNMLIEIRNSINELNSKVIQENDLNLTIDSATRKYLKTPIERKKYFSE